MLKQHQYEGFQYHEVTAILTIIEEHDLRGIAGITDK